MQVSLSADFSGLVNRLKGKAKALQDKTAPLQRCAVILLRTTSERFRRQVSPGGTPWKELSLYTIKQRRKGPKANLKPQILRDTGRLLNSLSGAGPEAIKRIRANVLEFGTNVNYGWTHQAGRQAMGRIPAVPARPFLGITDEDQRAFARIFSDWIKATLGQR